ncbi:TetR/AcrR family transcriptional regulator [Novosphingobium sp. FSW06-99]|uniref:TetR/AcrR family transcriptional regulator n=1 Tax=Novosphingobium sp. FSW06-99 TaxID=1739113 RepID=UPI00076DCE09|nr:TetR/AcrR family transcriptional regulator [Novosphingobium sp. FSW06-99]KUR79760.1 TetR family transcriptional regulator [Novosphingobium sp. FSW06-99]
MTPISQGSANPGKRLRRSQAERRAETRDRVIQAAIASLFRNGYSATSISVVAADAGVSRGAMTHQFPAKTDLMLAVVRAVFDDDGALYNDSIATLSPYDWLLALPETMWRVISRPSGIAVIEIMLASRSDPDLAEKLRALQAQIDTQAHAWSAQRVRDAGFEPHPDAEAIHDLFVAAVRGMALNAVVMDNTQSVKRQLEILSGIMRSVYLVA